MADESLNEPKPVVSTVPALEDVAGMSNSAMGKMIQAANYWHEASVRLTKKLEHEQTKRAVSRVTWFAFGCVATCAAVASAYLLSR